MTIHIYRGMPGSGKTTTARQRVGVGGGILAGRDHVRNLMGLHPGRTTRAQEAAVTTVQAGLIRAGVRAGLHVHVDDTTLREHDLDHLTGLAAALGVDVEIVDLRGVDVETCVTRDAQRTGPAHVGAETIRRIAAAQ